MRRGEEPVLAGRIALAALLGLAIGVASGQLAGHAWVALPCATAAWLLALRSAAATRAWVVLAFAVTIRGALACADFHSNDLHRYVWEGRVQLEGVSPFATAPSHPDLVPLRDARFEKLFEPDLPTVYPPLAQAAFAAWAALGLEELGFRNAVLVLDALVVLALVGWLRATGRRPGWALVYAASPVALASAAGGHIDPLMLLGLVGFAWAHERGRAALAAAGLAAAILAKTVAVLLLPWLLLRRPRPALVVTLPLVAAGYLPYAVQGDVVGSLFTFASDFAFNGALFPLLDALDRERAPLAAGALLATWTAAVALTQPRVATAWALTLAGLLVLAPTVHYWYLTWFLAALPALGASPVAAPLRAWAVGVLFALPAYLAVIRGDPLPGPVWTLVEYAIPLAALAAVSWRHRPRGVPRQHRGGSPPEGRVGVVIPALREAANLRRLLPGWLDTRVERVVVADLPCEDGTETLCRDLPRVRYVAVGRRGYGAAVAAGLDAVSDLDFAVVCDADHLRGPEQLEALLAPLRDPGVGLVTADRTRAARLTRLQRLGNALVTVLIALGWGRRFRDLGPYRALRIAAWRDLPVHDPGFGWNVEMNVRALEVGLGVVEVPLAPAPRPDGRDRITGSLRSALAAGAGILRRLYQLHETSGRPAGGSSV